MPTYDYLCQSCDHAFELFQQMTDPVKKKCPQCGKLKLRRLIGTGAGVIFKGGGFYETDYRSDSYKKAADAEKKSGDGAKDKKKGDAAASSDTKASSPSKTGEKTSSSSSSSSSSKAKSDN